MLKLDVEKEEERQWDRDQQHHQMKSHRKKIQGREYYGKGM
jgi:hypothetical protein